MSSNMQVAETIIKQMGGLGKLRAVVSASDFAADSNSVQFSFKGCRKANKCRVILDVGADLYRFELWKYNRRTFEIEMVYEVEGLYWDQLKPVFEQQTGLYLSL